MLRIYYPGPYSDKLQTTTSFSKEGVQNRLTVLSGVGYAGAYTTLDSTLTNDSPGGRFVCLSFLGMTSATAKPELGEPQAELWDVGSNLKRSAHITDPVPLQSQRSLARSLRTTGETPSQMAVKVERSDGM